ncbi:HNH endonuclease [Lewinella sp. JB7]|uniref:HNH endonuclease n=1 Tax=Lewinella sp. JB7 TaxID=2962887 RepID=UPI0035323472
MVDKFKRYQTGLTLTRLFPQPDKSKCACGCNAHLSRNRRRWATKECQMHALKNFLIVKGDTGTIRNELFHLDKGFCRWCGIHDPQWEADHILPVYQGGGATSIENFQTLCKSCHLEKTRAHNESHRSRISSHAVSTFCKRRLKALGAE